MNSGVRLVLAGLGTLASLELEEEAHTQEEEEEEKDEKRRIMEKKQME